MIELSSFQLAALLALALFCFILLVGLLVVLMKRKNKVLNNMTELSVKLKESEKERLQSMNEMFRPYFSDQEGELSKFSDKALENERKFYQSLVDIYGGNDVSEVKNLDTHVKQLLKPHARVLTEEAKKMQDELIEKNNELQMALLSNEEALDELFEQYVRAGELQDISNPRHLSAQEKLSIIRRKPLKDLLKEVDKRKDILEKKEPASDFSSVENAIIKEMWQDFAKANELDSPDGETPDVANIIEQIMLKKPYAFDDIDPKILAKRKNELAEQARAKRLEKETSPSHPTHGEQVIESNQAVPNAANSKQVLKQKEATTVATDDKQKIEKQALEENQKQVEDKKSKRYLFKKEDKE